MFCCWQGISSVLHSNVQKQHLDIQHILRINIVFHYISLLVILFFFPSTLCYVPSFLAVFSSSDLFSYKYCLRVSQPKQKNCTNRERFIPQWKLSAVITEFIEDNSSLKWSISIITTISCQYQLVQILHVELVMRGGELFPKVTVCCNTASFLAYISSEVTRAGVCLSMRTILG